MEIVSSIFIILALVLISGIFSGGEIAVISVSDAKAKELEGKKGTAYSSLLKLKKDPDKFLIVILIGNNIVNIAVATFTAKFTTDVFGDVYLSLSAGILTFLLLVFGEIIPKTFCQEHNLKISLILSPFFLFLKKVLFPLVLIFEKILFIFKKKGVSKKITEDEVLAMVNLGSEKGEIETHEKEFFENILEFSDKLVKEIATARSDIIGIDKKTKIDDAIKLIVESTYSRLPVFDGNIDKIEGILTVKDFLKYSLDKKGNNIYDIDLLPILKVPSTKKIKDLFDEFQKKRMHFAVVIDEHGKTAGIVTLEDILEEIVGEIEDESDEKENKILKLEKNIYLVSGAISIEELNNEINLSLSTKSKEDWKSIRYFILEKTGDLPSEGQRIKISEKLEIIITQVKENKIEKVKIIILD